MSGGCGSHPSKWQYTALSETPLQFYSKEIKSRSFIPPPPPPPPPLSLSLFTPIGSEFAIRMSSGELLGIEPLELKFPFELRKQISCTIKLTNKTEDHVAFKVKTTSPKKYCVRPNTGVVAPGSFCEVVVTMQAQKDAPPDLQCKDKFLVQSIITSPGISAKDISQEMFTKESGNKVEEVKLRVVYIAPANPPSPVPEESEEGTSPRTSDVSARRALLGQSDNNSAETASMIAKLTEEKNSAVHQNRVLKQELDNLRREIAKQQAGSFSLLYVVLFALIGILLGYFLRK
ncbi:hypothetical protein LUZ60_007359 [Juncus effusus]|nr:hypothetical protein LUZ60_007359 [Juncus effusus]